LVETLVTSSRELLRNSLTLFYVPILHKHQTGVTIVNRESGAGCRQLLERLLIEAGVPSAAVQGFDHLVYSHWEVAQAIASGKADTGVSNAAIAAAFDLDFMPLHQSRYDLVVLKEYLELAAVERLFSTLNNRWVHAQLKVLAGYDIAIEAKIRT